MDSSNCKQEDVFDQLPDHLLLLIFNKLHDAKSLCSSMTVCNRFRSIIPQTDTVFLTVPRRNIPFHLTNKEESDGCDSKSTARKRFLKTLINKVVLKPLRFLAQIVARKSSNSCECECECEDDNNSILSPNESLKNFDDIRSLNIELPSHGNEIGSGSGSNGGDSLLKWKAEFGKELQSCVILAATSFGDELNGANSDEQRDSSEEELKVRVVWSISCLIAASSRHYMLQKLISDHQNLESLVITDANKQGKICMQKQQIEEVIEDCMSTKLSEPVVVAALERTRVPALRVKMWYVPVLELPASGCVMKGATLMVIRPGSGADQQSESDDRDLVMGAFDEAAFGEAVRKMMEKKKTYTLEMNSF